MIRALVTDVSRVLLFPKDKNYTGSLNSLHKQLAEDPKYKLFDHFEVNTELLDFYTSLKDELTLYIFTSETIQDAPELQPYWRVFAKIFSAQNMKTDKKDSLAYQMIAQDIQREPTEMLYIDDSIQNIDAANAADLQTIRYLDNKNVIAKIQEKLLLSDSH
jgi:HAD superfamily hydrolase (TIGR01509 family)